MRLFSLLTLLFTFSFGLTQSQISLRDVEPGKIGFTAFKLDQPGKIEIKGTGGVYGGREFFQKDDWRTIVYYGWILDAKTRKVVWHQIDVMDKMDLDYGEFDFRNEVSLGKGTYELYFTGAYVNREEIWDKYNYKYFFSSKNEDFMANLPRPYYGNKIKFKNSCLDLLGIQVNGPTSITDVYEILKLKVSDAIVSALQPDKNANIKKGFSLAATTSIHIYAIGEGIKDEHYDYAWIYNIDKHERAWEMDRFNMEYAGGDKKNSMFEGTFTLPAGNYMLNYVSDDSHHFNAWNAMPPNDPQFSGVTMWAETIKDKANVIPFKMPEEMKPVLEITKVSNDEFISKGISLKAPLELRILCLGEESNDAMADGGRIINAASREVVWDMDNEHKENGGGARKNKVFDGTIKLDKGDYIVSYATDDSHAYGEWNSGPPHEQEYWGITLWATKKEDLSKIAVFEPGIYKNKNVVAEILQVRDDEYLSESFELSKDTRLRIMAIGEGVEGEMVDYAWIKDTNTGKTFWKLLYENTENAGGSRKNRRYNDVILLPKGSYELYYKTDDSHSYRNWNDSPPDDQEQYGVSVQLEPN